VSRALAEMSIAEAISAKVRIDKAVREESLIAMLAERIELAPRQKKDILEKALLYRLKLIIRHSLSGTAMVPLAVRLVREGEPTWIWVGESKRTTALTESEARTIWSAANRAARRMAERAEAWTVRLHEVFQIDFSSAPDHPLPKRTRARTSA
jgi:hypothetical protein